jgi:hypothetical protein
MGDVAHDPDHGLVSLAKRLHEQGPSADGIE